MKRFLEFTGMTIWYAVIAIWAVLVVYVHWMGGL